MALLQAAGLLCLTMLVSSVPLHTFHNYSNTPMSLSADVASSRVIQHGRSTSLPTSTDEHVNTSAVLGRLRLNLFNSMAEGPVYAFLTGQDPNNKLVMLTNSGTFYYPATSSFMPQQIPYSADAALKLGGQGSSTCFIIPEFISSARLWFSQGKPLLFSVTNTGGLVEPSSADDTDPNNDTNWGFVELDFSESMGLYVNPSYVDMLGLPLGISIKASGSVVQSAFGPHQTAVAEVCQNLRTQAAKDGHPWQRLCKNDSNGNLIRIVSPQTLIGQDPVAFAGYFEPYVDLIYERFAGTSLYIQTQEALGLVQCNISSGSLTCTGDDETFDKPSTEDIFSCSTGSFANGGNAVHLAVVPRICAAFNRATLHLPGGNVQPSLPPSHYYKPPINNWYSAFVHRSEYDGKVSHAPRGGYNITPSN